MKRFTTAIFTCVLTLSLLSNQSFVYASELNAEVQSMIQATNTELDQNTMAFQQLDEEARLDESARPKNERKEKRWTRILTRRMPRYAAAMAKKIDSMSDEEVASTINHLREKAETSSNHESIVRFNAFFNDSISSREALKQADLASLPKVVAIAAHQIALAGGAVSFLLKAKKEIREMNEQAEQASMLVKHTTSRSPASLADSQTLGFVFAVAALASLVLMGIFPVAMPYLFFTMVIFAVEGGLELSAGDRYDWKP